MAHKKQIFDFPFLPKATQKTPRRWSFAHYRQTSNISRSLVGNKTSPRCSWSIACRCCSNYILILDLTPGSKGLSKDNCKTRRETCMFWDLVHFILKIWRYNKSISSCVNSTFCTKIPRTSDAYVRQWIKSSCIQMMACRLFGTSSLSEPILAYCPFAPWEQTSVKFGAKYHNLYEENVHIYVYIMYIYMYIARS